MSVAAIYSFLLINLNTALFYISLEYSNSYVLNEVLSILDIVICGINFQSEDYLILIIQINEWEKK
jgi:hypothetical protein